MAMNKNRIIELCLVFLVSILSFSIGTFVGKKYSDNQHRLALLDPNYKHDLNEYSQDTEKTAAAHQETTTEVAKDEHGNPLKATITEGAPISDADVAKISEEMEEEEESADTVKTINQDGTKAAVKKTGQEIVREVANISAKAKSITQDDKTIDGKSQYTVQVGSFPSPAEADKVVSSLQARGYKASQASATVNGKTWYRVQVGLFNSLQDAQIYKKELVEQNHLTSAMILRVNK